MTKIKEFKSIVEASKELKISTIFKCCKDKLKKAFGFIFKFV